MPQRSAIPKPRSADGAVLVRPDGFLAWSAPDAHAAELAALPTVLADTLAW